MSEQTFLKRQWLLDNMDIFLRETLYHRQYGVEEDYPGITVYVDPARSE